jgi:hypothetical protein
MMRDTHTHSETHCQETWFELLARLTKLRAKINGNNFGIEGLSNKN